MFPTMW